MAKKPQLSIDAKINALTRLVEKGFAAIVDDISKRPTNSTIGSLIENYVPGIVRKEIAELVPGMVRKEIAELVPGIVALELKPVREQLGDIEHRLDTVEEH